MKIIFRFSRVYFILFVISLIIEVLIALFVNDRFIRPYIGDLLVVILVYCFVRSFLRAPVLPTAIAVLLFAYVMEACQFFRLIYRLGWEHSRFARIVMGIGFDWMDILMYTLGFLVILGCDRLIKK